jgi:hypothetical protein
MSRDSEHVVDSHLVVSHVVVTAIMSSDGCRAVARETADPDFL